MLFLQTFLLLVISSLVVFGQHTFSSGSSTYTLIEQPKTWEAAKSYAEGQGGQLLEIDSATEMEVVQNALESYFAGMSSAQRTAFLNATRAPDGGGAAYLWLGGSDAASEGEWRWVSTDQQFWSGEYNNGNSVGGAYHNWGTGGGVIQEPDNYQNQDALALGLETWPYGALSWYLLGTAYQWNDIDLNSNQLYFIIEKDLGNPGIEPPASIAGLQVNYTPSSDVISSVPYQDYFGSDGIVRAGFSGSILERFPYTYANGVITYPSWDEEVRLSFESSTSGTWELWELEGGGYSLDGSGTFTVVSPSLVEKTDWQRTETLDDPLSDQYWNVWRRSVDALAYDDGELSFIFAAGGNSDPDTEIEYGRTLPMDENWQVVLEDMYAAPGLSGFYVELELDIADPEFQCELYFADYGYGNGREFGVVLEQQLPSGDWEYAQAYITANEDTRISSGGNVRIVHIASSRELIFEYQPDGASEWSELARLNLESGSFQGENAYGSLTGGILSATGPRMTVEIEAQVQPGVATQIADLEIAGIEIGSYTPASVVESNGNTDLLKNENGYFIGSESRPLLWEGAQLGDLPGWTYLGVETGSNYAFDLLLTDGSTYYVFYVDNDGDIVDYAELSQVELRVYETSWNEDLDGDSQIGNPPASVVESNGNTDLLKNENGYFIGSESRPLLWEGAQLGDLPGWTYMAVEAGSNYAFDLLLTDGSTYYVFYVDNDGDIVDYAELSQVELRVYETSWNEDLDGDSQIGNPPASVVESNGNTDLLKNENGYFIGSESRPLLWEGAQLGDLPGWTYLGVETGSNYAFDLLLTDGSTYYVFYVDNDGDIVDYAELSQVELRVYETSWNEDLDGDSQIGNPPASVVESNGNTDLLKNENGYFIGSESRPLLWEGAQLGDLPGWTYMAVEAGSNYAFDLLLTDGKGYFVFYVDNDGDIVDYAELSQVELRVYETSWNEDLDGDSQIGNPPASVVESNGNTDLLKNENGYFIGSESRPLLWEGAQLGDLPGWTYLGVETGSNYAFDLLLTDGSTYYVFYVDNDGDIVDYAELSQVELRVYETSWNEDLDGDSYVGPNPNEYAPSSIEPGTISYTEDNRVIFFGSNNDFIAFYTNLLDGLEVGSYSYNRTSANTAAFADGPGTWVSAYGSDTFGQDSYTLKFNSPTSATRSYDGASFNLAAPEDLAPTSLTGSTAYTDGYSASIEYGATYGSARLAFSTSSNGNYYGNLEVPLSYTYTKVGPREGRINATGYHPSYGSVNVSYVFHFLTATSGYFAGVETFSFGLVETEWGTFSVD